MTPRDMGREIGSDQLDAQQSAPFTLQLFHLSDQEANTTSVTLAPNASAVLNVLSAQDLDGDGVEGYADTLTLSSGDIWLPGLFYNASEPIWGTVGAADILIANLMGVQASAFGNHEFDQGTGVIRDLIAGLDPALGFEPFDGAAFPYLSANLDFSGDAALAGLVAPDHGDARPGVIARSVVVETAGGARIGVVGATTPTLPQISSPGNGVAVEPEVSGRTLSEVDLDALAASVQHAVDGLLATNGGLDKVILLAHMQVLSVEQALAERLRHVDIIVAGGSNAVLLDEDDIPFAGDTAAGPYPIFERDADGNPVAVVNTDKNYEYIGRLVVDFDENGLIIPESYDSAVSGAYAADAAGLARLGATVEGDADPQIVAIAERIREGIIAGESEFFGVTTVFLNAERSGGGIDGVRTQETNLGNLTADANLWYAREYFDESVVISYKNGGGIRQNIGTIVEPGGGVPPLRLPPEGVEGAKPEGGISKNNIADTLAFNNGLSLLSLTTQQIADMLEFTVGNYTGQAESAGGWGQFSGLKFSFDPAREAGSRVVNAGIVDEDGAVIAEIVRAGRVADNGDQTFRIITLDFLAGAGRGGLPITDPNAPGFDPAIAAQVNRVDIVDRDSFTGPAFFSPDGGEQDALAEYLLLNFGRDPEAEDFRTFDEADTPVEFDTRIQNLEFRADEVLPARINEFVFNHSGADDREYVEVLAGPLRDLSDLWLIQIEGDGSGAGVVDSATQLATANADGLWWTGFLANTFENGTVTLKLVQDFAGSEGQDLDAENDGVLDSTPWAAVIDAVAVSDGGSSDRTYADTVLTRDFDGGVFTVGGASRLPDGAGDWVRNDFTRPGEVSANPVEGVAANTPNAFNAPLDTTPPEPEPTTIMAIQGAGHTSPLLGERVTTSGVVTAVAGNGFFMQDIEGDDDIATSNAIFVFQGGNPVFQPAIGDAVTVEGTVSEFTPGGAATRNLSQTQLGGSPVLTVESSGNALPAAVVLGAEGRLPPTGLIDDDAFAAFDPVNDPIDFYESLEGMLVTAAAPRAVSGANRFGEIFTVVDNGAGVDRFADRGALAIAPDNFNPEKLQLQFGSGNPLNTLETPQAPVGAVFADVTGVMSYAFGNFEVLVTEPVEATFIPDLAETATTIAGGADQLTIASYNVLNLDPNDADGDRDVELGRFDTLGRHIAVNLGSPDIVALQEVQDNSGSADDGVVSADETLQRLVDAIAAAGGPAYAFVDNPFIEDARSGGQPGGNIRTAYLYNPDRVDLVEGSLQTIGTQEGGQPFAGVRLPLIAEFAFNGETVTVVNNHFSSKSGSAAILGVEQPFELRQDDPTVNGTVDARLAQAQAVKDFVDALKAEDPDAKIAVVGDLNEFEFNPPVELLSESLANLVETLPQEERYSFVFQGNAQVLDHILVSSALAEEAQFEFVRVNVEYAETPERGSDHDPLVASLFIPAQAPEFNVIAGADRNDRLVGADLADQFIFGKGNDFATGGEGGDLFDFSLALSDGVRNVKQVLDYSPEEGDAIRLGDAAILSVRESAAGVTLVAGEDRDQIIIRGVSTFDQIMFDEMLLA